MEYDEIFSGEIPVPKGHRLKGVEAETVNAETKPKRKYTRKSRPSPPPIVDSETLTPFTDARIAAIDLPEASFSSFGLEYLRALTGLLTLITETQRTKLIDFIIQEKII